MQLLFAVDELYFPASQIKQLLDPADAAYLPTAQATHTDPFVEKYPTGHGVQESEEKQEDPAVVQETVQEKEQLVSPSLLLYFPAPQIKQSASSS